MANGPFLGEQFAGILVLLGPRIRFRVTGRRLMASGWAYWDRDSL
jgi:hypothetical protein